MNHTITHFEIPADDPEKLAEFYRKIFGWKIEQVPGYEGYWMIFTVPTDDKGMPTEPGINGGMMKRQSPEHTPVNYITVESLDEYAKRIEENGGKIVVPKKEVKDMGYFACAIDPQGNQFCIWENMQ
jgi:predicted enzyme related to lactoylglutathione lyase